MNKFFNKSKFFKSEFIQQVATLAGGTTLSQALPIIFSPVISRIYTPKEFGEFSFYLALANLLAILGSGRLEQAIPLPKKRSEGINLLLATWIMSFCLLIVIGLIITIFRSSIAGLLGLHDLEKGLILLPVTFFSIVIYQSLVYWHNRVKEFGKIATSAVLRTSTLIPNQVLLQNMSSTGLILSDIVSRILASLAMLSNLPKKIFNRISLSEILETIRIYKDFVFYTMPNGLLNYLSNNTPIFLLNKFFGSKETGLYSWAMRIVQTPMSVIISSIHQVFYRQLVEEFNENKKLLPIVINTYKRLFLIGIIPYSVLFIFSPLIFQFVFGIEWREAGIYNRILIPWLFLVFLNSPISSIVLVTKNQKNYLKYEIVLLIARVLAIIVGYMYGNIYFSLVLFSAVGVLYNLLLINYFLSLARHDYEIGVYR